MNFSFSSTLGFVLGSCFEGNFIVHALTGLPSEDIGVNVIKICDDCRVFFRGEVAF